jgi:CRISPR-associated protein Csx10
MYSMLIDFRSPVCIGSGGPGPGYVDREVVFSETGLPYIPARRIKGLLRDAFRDVGSILTLQGSAIDIGAAELELFGGIGESSSGKLRFCNAVLCDPQTFQPESTLDEWLTLVLSSQQAKDQGVIHREEIIQEFTDIRRQTRIGRAKGAAGENTLRVTRVLRSGLMFRATVHSSIKLSRAMEHILALAVSALKQMGSSRTRGLGQVRCSLLCGDANLNAEAIAALRANKLQAPENGAPEVNMVSADIGPPAGQAALRFRLTLNQPALFSSSEGDPNMTASLNHIPGSSLHGWLAWRFIEKYPRDEAFLKLFCRGGLRFLPAYPEVMDSGGKASLPVPLALQQKKGITDSYVNLFANNDWAGTSRLRKQWTLPDQALYGGTLTKLEVPAELHYHHARPSTDRRLGRAIGAEQANLYDLPTGGEGAVFTYEQIKAGSSFVGAIVGDRAGLEFVRALLGEEPPNAILGRSRSGQYGADASWQWLDPSPVNLASLGETEWSAVPEFLPGDELLALVLSPLLTVNAAGHPVAEFPAAQFETVSCLKVSPVNTNTSFARAAWSSSYLTHQRLPRQQLPCIEAGSIFRLRFARSYTADEFKTAAHRVSEASFGLRTEQGNGRLALLPLSNLSGGTAHTYRRDRSARKWLSRKDSCEWSLAKRIYERRLTEAAVTDALATAADHGTRVQSLTPGLLIRLVELVESDFLVIRRKLAMFRQKARDRIMSCTVRRQPFPHSFSPSNGHSTARTLEDLICALAENSTDYYRAICRQCFEVQGWNKIFGPLDPLENDSAICTNLIRTYTTVMLNGLAWKVRDERRRGNGQGGRA